MPLHVLPTDVLHHITLFSNAYHSSKYYISLITWKLTKGGGGGGGGEGV